jgi:hypothetical protein
LNLDRVPRSAALTITWNPAPGTVILLVSNYDHPSNATSLVVCSATGASGSFTIPTYSLQTIPASRAASGQSIGHVMAGMIRSGTTDTFTVPSLSAGLITFISWAAKAVLFQ